MLRRKATRWKFDEDQLECGHLPTIKDELQKAIIHYKSHRKNAKALRLSFLEEKAELIAEERGIDKSKYLSHLIKTEELKEMYRRIRHI